MCLVGAGKLDIEFKEAREDLLGTMFKKQSRSAPERAHTQTYTEHRVGR